MSCPADFTVVLYSIGRNCCITTEGASDQWPCSADSYSAAQNYLHHSSRHYFCFWHSILSGYLLLSKWWYCKVLLI